MSAGVQLQRELLETILEEKTERMQAIHGILEAIAELKQENAALRKDNDDLRMGLNGGTPLRADKPGTPNGANSLEELGIKELQDRVEALELLQSSSNPKDGREGAAAALTDHQPTEEELAASQAEDVEQGNEMEYELQESMWDLALLIGLPGMGWLGSFHAAVLVVGNIFVQTVFCLLAQFNFTQPEFDAGTIDDIKLWRIGTAHDYTHIDALTNKALLTRVCGEDDSLYISGGQLDMFSQIINYLPEFDIEPLEGVPDWKFVDSMRENLNGVVMCVLAISCYHLSIMRELHAIWDKVKVFNRIPRGKTTLLSHDLEFERIACVRYTAIVVIAAIRFLLVASLFWTGSLFLIHDIGVADLLLNAVALEFVLNVDELIYEALAPRSGKLFLSKIKPLEVPPSRFRYKGMDMKSALFTVLVPVMVMTFYIWKLDPMVDQVRSAFEVMCGEVGKDFVYHTTLDGFVAVANSIGDDDDAEDIAYDSEGRPDLSALFKSLQEDIVSHLVYGTESLLLDDRSLNDARTTGHYKDITELPEWGTLTFPGLVSKFGTHCVDNFNSNYGIFKQAKYLLEELFRLALDGSVYNGRTLSGCADLAELCVMYEDPPGSVSWNTLARFLCPGTCGCNTTMGLFPHVPNEDQGCATQCDQLWQADYDRLECTDWTVEELQATSWWAGWANESWARQLTGNGTNAQGIGVLYEDGCNIIPSVYPSVLQSVTGMSIYQSDDYIQACFGALAKDYESSLSHKPLVSVCPRRCGCFPDPANGKNSFGKEYEIYSHLVDAQNIVCPTSCTQESQLSCTSVPSWVCDTNSDSETTTDLIFLDEDGFSVWDAACTRDGSQFDEYFAQFACYDCTTENPTWLCDSASARLQLYPSGGDPSMPSDIFVYEGQENTRAEGSDVKAYYAYCNQSTSRFNTIQDRDAGFQSLYSQMAYACYEWVCTTMGDSHCKYCQSSTGRVNAAGWTFNCSQEGGEGGEGGEGNGPGDGQGPDADGNSSSNATGVVTTTGAAR